MDRGALRLASLIEEFISVMESEDGIYKELIPIVDKKTRIIINNDLQALQDITEQEQIMIERINALERKREEVIVNIGTVVNKDPRTLDMKTVIRLMEKQPSEQRRLMVIHDSLKGSLNQIAQINELNKSLIQQSLEMIEFNVNLIQSTRMSPGTNDYTRNANPVWDGQIGRTGMFDAKQ